MRYVSEASSAMIDRVLTARTQNFVDLVRTAGLDPARDFRGTLLRGFDFTGCDLDDFDFSSSQFAECRFGDVNMGSAQLEGTTFESCDFDGVDPVELQRWTAAAVDRGPRPGKSADLTSFLPKIRRRDKEASGSADELPAGDDARGANWSVAVCRLVRDLHVPEPLDMGKWVEIIRAMGGTLGSDTTVNRLASGGEYITLGFQSHSTEPVHVVLTEMRNRALASIRSRAVHGISDMFVGAATSATGSLEVEKLEAAALAGVARAHAGEPIVVTEVGAGEIRDDNWITDDELRRAVAEDQFVLRYQPKLSLRDATITGVEASMRWHHPQRGQVAPEEYLPAAEAAGMLQTVTIWALQRMIADQATALAANDRMTFFIDLPPELLADAEFVQTFCAMVRSSEAMVGVEIPETAILVDPQAALTNLRFLSDQGIRIAVDDYGAGLSSLAYLKQMPATELKIDRSFIRHLTNSNRDPLLVRSTIDLAHALNMVVTATGLETEAALALLTVMGCDQVQGFLVAKPLDISNLIDFLQHPRLPDALKSVGTRDAASTSVGGVRWETSSLVGKKRRTRHRVLPDEHEL